jgi:hypothetical protein
MLPCHRRSGRDVATRRLARRDRGLSSDSHVHVCRGVTGGTGSSVRFRKWFRAPEMEAILIYYSAPGSVAVRSNAVGQYHAQ